MKYPVTPSLKASLNAWGTSKFLIPNSLTDFTFWACGPPLALSNFPV